jgi:negative regulator of flagellin synthesis FlgM
MIKSVGQMISSPVDLGKARESGKAKAAPSVDAAASGRSEATSTPAARMAAQGAPVDFDRVAAIKSAIAAGNYPVDAKLIAEKMIALDMPGEH